VGSIDVQVCQVVIEVVNVDYGEFGEHTSIRSTKSSPATCMIEILVKNHDGITSHHRSHDQTHQAETTARVQPRLLDP